MSDRMTTIELAGYGGISEYGRKTPSEMVAAIRRHAAAQLAEAQVILAAPDSSFRVYTHLGVHVPRRCEVLQQGHGSNGGEQ